MRAFLAAAIVAGAGAAACGIGDPCGNQLRATVVSPSGRHKAVVFIRDCGATTGFSTHVSVLPAGEALVERPTTWYSTQSGNALVLDDESDSALTAAWENDTQLVLRYPSSFQVYKVAPSASGVTVRHQRRDSERVF